MGNAGSCNSHSPLASPANSNASPTSANSNASPSVSISRSPSFNSSQLLAQRKLFAESQIGRSSFQKLLEPKHPQLPGIAPYRVVLGNVKDKVSFLIYFTDIIDCMDASIPFLLSYFFQY